MIIVMSALTPEQARAYLDRWALVREVETRELRTASLELKAQQLGVLMPSRELFKNDPEREREITGVRDRWARIRRASGG